MVVSLNSRLESNKEEEGSTRLVLVLEGAGEAMQRVDADHSRPIQKNHTVRSRTYTHRQKATEGGPTKRGSTRLVLVLVGAGEALQRVDADRLVSLEPCPSSYLGWLIDLIGWLVGSAPTLSG